jgi:alpha-L-rhamnosidase
VINAGDKPNPAGLIGLLKIELEQGEPILIRTDEEWRTVNKDTANWEKPETDFSSWAAAKPIAEFGGAPWTKLTVVESDNRPLPARHLRREFDADKPIRQATAHICGLGYYELYLNGNRVGNHVLDPNYTHYSKRVHYVTYDVGDMLRKGRNAVGVILGNSRYYAPRSAYPFATVDYGFPKLLLQMRIEYADGTTADIVSDESWKLTTNGPIRENNDYDGEVFDARMEMPGWAAAGFDDSKWEPAQAVKAPEGVLSAQMAPPIRVTETLKPVSLTNPRPGVYVYDMGQNFVGWVRLKVQGPAGTRVRLRHAEALDKDGTVYMENLRSARCADEYTLKGSGAETYEPRFTYHGFQFVELTGYPGTPTLETIEGKAVHSDVEPMGKFTCSDATINRIVRNIHWGIRGNLRSIPTDCPQRDERHGWLGDIANESKGESFEFNMATFFTKWLRDISDSQNEKGSIPDVAPPYWVMYNDNVTWPATYTLIPGWFYEQYGDKRLVAANYPGICRWIAHMRGYMKDDLMPRDTYGDWCVPPESPELIHSKDPARKTDPELLGSSYFFHCVQLAARYAELLGKADDAKQFRELAAKMKTAFNRKFFHADKGIYSNGTQTSCVLPLAFGLVAEEHRAAVFRNLVDDIVVKNKGHIATGLVGGQWLMRALTAGGRPDVAYGIATKTDYPSWGYMAEKGATTIWELWNGDTADPAMNSRNHLMLVGDLSIWLYESIGGIKSDAAKPGFKHIVMRPIPIVGLASAAASHNSMYGMIRSEWKIEGGRFIWNVTVPVNTTATVYVPSVDGAQVAESGKLASQADGVTFLRNEDGAAIYELASGSYRFIAPHRPIAH